MAKNGKPKQEDVELPEDLVPIDTEPIVPGVQNTLRPIAAPATIQAAPPQLGNYFSGPMPSDIQHDGQFIKTGYQTGSSVRTPLMPTPLVANPQNTAGIESVIREFVSVVAVPPTNGTGAVDDMIFRGTWNDFTNYSANDVVLFGTFTYIAIASSTNVTPSGNPTFWTQIGGPGSVTSVALTMPSVFSVAGSPISSSGTFVVTFQTQTANTVFAGPTTGIAAIPTFRALVTADIPNLPASIITTGQIALARGGTHADLSGTGGAHFVLRQSSVGADVTVSQLSYSDISGVAPAPVSASVNLTAQGANVAATTLFAVVSAGLYRITVYMIVSRAASTTSTMPDSQIIFTDEDSNATITANVTAGDSGNTTSTFAQVTFVVNAKASTNIQYAIGQVTAFASSGGTSMQFAYRARVEYLG